MQVWSPEEKLDTGIWVCRERQKLKQWEHRRSPRRASSKKRVGSDDAPRDPTRGMGRGGNDIGGECPEMQE